MKTVILAGGFGSRISEESHLKPKPMIEIGGKPILWHIMKLYSSQGFNEFIICCGYKGYLIKEYFANYFLHTSDITLDLVNNSMQVHNHKAEPWKVTLIDTGEQTETGGRIRRIRDHVQGKFFLTYGDGLSDIDLNQLLDYHDERDCYATVTAVMPPGRFGSLKIEGKFVESFSEKPKGDGKWINGGFFVCEPEVFQFLCDNSGPWDHKPLEAITNIGKLAAYKYAGFWQPMDTLRDKNFLEKLWSDHKAPWKKW